jgi:predicted lysophospholipase L1 biosynthesis ABC-type transport system permease subunit
VDAALGKAIAVNPPVHLLPKGAVPPDYEPTLFTIVGVAADVRYGAMQAAPPPLVYTPYSQGSEGETTLYLVVRSDSDPAPLAAAIRDRIRRVDADVPASNIRTMDQRVAASLARPRLNTMLLGAFAGLALVLAATGVYGVIAHAARQRTQEIGIRMAVGASPSAIGSLFLGQGLRLVCLGVVAGLVGALALTRTLQPLLFGVHATDALVFGAITVLLLLVGTAAAWLPARRAARLDPLAVLREG